MDAGREWILDVDGLDGARIGGTVGLATLQALFADLVAALSLRPVREPVWHLFDAADGVPGAGGVTGLVALAESHLACHSFPEGGYLSLNLYTCRERPAPRWDELLERRLGDCRVHVRSVRRGAHLQDRTRSST